MEMFLQIQLTGTRCSQFSQKKLHCFCLKGPQIRLSVKKYSSENKNENVFLLTLYLKCYGQVNYLELRNCRARKMSEKSRKELRNLYWKKVARIKYSVRFNKLKVALILCCAKKFHKNLKVNSEKLAQQGLFHGLIISLV